MHGFRLVAAVCALALGLWACDGDGGTEAAVDTVGGVDVVAAVDTGHVPEPDIVASVDVPTAPEGDGYVAPESPACFGQTLVVQENCAALVEGYNTDFMVDGEARSFYLHFPPNVSMGGPWPVVFNWHGFGDSATNMARLLSGRVLEEDYQFILVTPEGRGYFPPDGMEWDQLVIGEEENSEARLFDEVLECLNQRFRVDPDRVHSVGFSAGAITSDLLGVLRGHCLASTASFSGAYFANEATHALLGDQAGAMVSWPEMTTENTYAQLVAHGGTDDAYNLVFVTLQFDEAARLDADFLNGRGHDVVFCEHGLGHTVPFTMWGADNRGIMQFLSDHPRGAASPYLEEGLPEVFPDYCSVRPAE